MTVLIFANGEIEGDLKWIRPYLEQATAVIAADGGSSHLFALQHAPDLVIGDCDSLTAEIKSWLDEEKTPFITYATAKDETDLELALIHAVDTYSDPILLFGLLGGRLDQTLANILLLAHPKLNGRRVELVTAYERAWLVRKQTQFQGQIGDIVSLIPLAGDVYILETTGLAWPLHAETLSFGLARGISNAMVESTVTISIQSGSLLCIHKTQ